ncbi:hypothetical protein ACFLTP_03700 [Chloroflexota bacterium]
MKGSIRQRAKDKWQITIDRDRDPTTKKRQRHYETVKDIKKEAERRLHQLLYSVESNA